MSQTGSNSLERKLDELIWCEVYHDTIRGSEWLSPDLPFSPGRGAIGYPVMYVLYRILNEVKPKSILELGMGQTTKLIGSYAAYYKGCSHKIVEHDESWIEFFSNHFQLPDSTKVIKCDIEDATVELEDGGDKQYTNVTRYVGFKEALKDCSFDLIMIDGPYGYRSPDYSRVDILSILTECLNSEFVILMDDCNRNGEWKTCELICWILKDAGIPCCAGTYSGEKDMVIIVSPNLKFLCSM